MTTVERPTMTSEDVLAAVTGLTPTLTARAAEIEQARRVPEDLLDALVAAGCFRVLLPHSHGGFGADLPAAMRIFETLASADASTAWTVGIGASCWCDVAGLPRASFDSLLGAAPDVILAGAFNPTGSITPVDGGYRVSGRWSFASGCEHATWLFGNCVESITDGVPRLRLAVFPPSDATIEDTWNVSGLCGTGSHHFRVEDVVVAAERTHEPFADEPCLDEPITRIPLPTLYSLEIASVAIGIARGALDDIVAIATTKVPLLAEAPLASNALFQFELATADTELRAARNLVYDTAASVWEVAVDRGELSLEQRARARAGAAWATSRAAAIVDTAYRSGGGSSLYADCPLQRRLRDVHAVTQHFLVKADTLTTAGAILAGQELTVPVF